MLPLYVHVILGIVSLLVAAPLAGLGVHEMTRWKESNHQCKVARADSQVILNMDMCHNAALARSRIGNLCDEARTGLQISEFECTARTYWRTSGFAHIYAQVTENQIAVLVLAIVCSVYVIHRIFSMISCGIWRSSPETRVRIEEPDSPVLAMVPYEARPVLQQHQPAQLPAPFDPFVRTIKKRRLPLAEGNF